MKNNDFKDIVFNRRSIKNFHSDVKITREELLEMIEETTKAPSSVNLQPWRFVVVESEEGKEKLRPLVKFNINQNDTSSAMILIFGDIKGYENAEKIFGTAVEKGFMPEEVKNQLIDNYIPFYEAATKQEINDIVKIDSSLAAMQLMLVARAHGYDTNPIGGFEKDQLAEAFGLNPERYLPVVIIAIGKANYTPHETIRLDVEEIVTFK